MRATTILIVLVPAAMALGFTSSGGWRDADFECGEVGRRLDDKELLQKLVSSVREGWVAARDLAIPTVTEMQSRDAQCCSVTRDPAANLWADDWEKDNITWWRRLLDSPTIFVTFRYQDPPVAGQSFAGSGLLSTCGDVIDMSFTTEA
jgi:hypothetical protein